MQMFDLEKDQTALTALATDTYDDLIRTNSEEAIDHLNWGKVRMTPPHFCLQYQKIGGPVKDRENIKI